MRKEEERNPLSGLASATLASFFSKEAKAPKPKLIERLFSFFMKETTISLLRRKLSPHILKSMKLLENLGPAGT